LIIFLDILNSALAKLRSNFRKLFPYSTDVCIEIIDALSSNVSTQSQIKLTLSQFFTRDHTSLSHAVSSYYKPRNIGANDSKKLKQDVDRNIQNVLCQHLNNHPKDYNLFAIDATPHKRPHAKKLTDKSFVYSPGTISSVKPIVVGHKYSYVNYLTEENHWALPIDIKRVTTTENDTVVGVEQWTNIINDEKNQLNDKTAVGVFDSAYSNAYAMSKCVETKSENSIFIARIRGDRVLMRPSVIESKGKRGRPSIFDIQNPFKLKDNSTWGNPTASKEIDWQTKKGKNHSVQITMWDNLRMRGHKDAQIQHTPLNLVRISVSDKDGKTIYKNPLWLIMVGNWPIDWFIERYWYFYCARFDIEHYFRFGKQRLLMSSFQTPETSSEENWMIFVMVAYHQLYHARIMARNLPNDWERNKVSNHKSLPPSRVQRDMPRLLQELPTITTEVKTRGIPKGRKVGEKTKTRDDSSVVRKSAPKTAPKANININWEVESNGNILKPNIKCRGIDKSKIPTEIMTTFQNVEHVVPKITSPP
jgi:hypothetical protein